MRRNIAKSAAMVGAAALALGLAACGSNGDTPEPDAPGDDAAAEEPGEVEEPSEPVELEYLHRLPDGEGMTPVAEIVERWNEENPNIQVSTTKFDGNAHEMIVKLETDINAGVGVCLAQLGYGEVPEMYVKGLVEDVTEYADEYRDNFGGAFGQMTVGDATIGLPQDSGPLIYMYNEAEFDELGIDVPSTTDEFLAAAETAAAEGKYIAAFTPDEAQYWLSAQAASAGGVWYGAENDQWVVNTDSDESAVVAEFWQELLDNDLVYVGDRWGEAFDVALTDGDLIGHYAAAWEVGFALDVLDGTDAEGQWRVAQLPEFGAGPLTGPDGGSGVAVMQGCEYPAEAMAFNNWFNTQVDDLAQQGLVPAASIAAENPEKWLRQFGDQDVMAELVEANSRLNADFAYIPGFSAVGPRMNEAAAAAGSGSGTVADVFEVAQEASIAALNDQGLPVAD